MPASVASPSPTPWSWPGGVQAAVSLTYDDALDSQFNIAAPDLRQRGLRGTFFLLGENLHPDNFEEWTVVGAEGNELGSHTMTHPCAGDSPAFTPRKISEEIDAANALVRSISRREPASFAYPCGDRRIGPPGLPFDYSTLIATRFLSARIAEGLIANPRTVALLAVPGVTPQLSFQETDGSSLIAKVREAEGQGGWIVFIFHAVGEDDGYKPVSREAHAQLLDYLAANRLTVWTAPFGEVGAFIAGVRAPQRRVLPLP